MRTLNFIYIILLLTLTASGQTKRDNDDCYFKGRRLYGRVQIVDSFPDLKVQIVTSFPDLKVKTVENTPSRCGEWKMVDNFPDLKIQIVNSFPDIKVQFVQAFPGRTSTKLKQ